MRSFLLPLLCLSFATPVFAFDLSTNIQVSEAPVLSNILLLQYSNITTGKDSQSKAYGLVNRMDEEVKKIKGASMTVNFNQDLVNKRTFFQATVKTPSQSGEATMKALNPYAKLEGSTKETTDDDLHARQTLAAKILEQKKEYCDMFKCVNINIKSVNINQGFRPMPMMAMAKVEAADSMSVDNIGIQPITLTANVVYDIQ